MKKTITSILFLFLFLQFGAAQCDIENPSFEDWSFQEFQLETNDGTIYENDVFLPDTAVSVIRTLFIAFELFVNPALGELLETDPQGLFGIDRSTDASDGDYAIKLQVGYDIPVADIYSPNACSEIPDSFAFDLKHYGNVEDTLSVFVIFDEGLAPLPQDESELQNYPAYAYGEFAYNSDSAYHRISLPVIENFEGPVDTFYYLIIAQTQDTSYFLVDNLQPVTEEDPVVCSFDNYPSFNLMQTNDVCICEEFANDITEGTFVTDFVTQDTVPPVFLVIDENDIIQYVSEGDINDLFQVDFCPMDQTSELYIVQLLYEDWDDISGTADTGDSNINDITGCHALSEKLLLSTVFEIMDIKMSLDGVILNNGEIVTVCNFDDIIELYSFTDNSDLMGTVFVIDAGSEIIVQQLDINENTSFDLPPGEYVVGLAGSLDPFPDVVGQVVNNLALHDCWYASDNFYQVVVLDNGDDGCLSATIDSEIINTIQILQNPVEDILTLQVQNSLNKKIELRILDINGKVHLSKSLETILSNININVSAIAQGSYFLQLASGDGIASYKFIKM